MTTDTTHRGRRDIWDWVLRAVAILSLVVSGVVAAQTHSYVACKRRYDDRSAKATAARADAADHDRSAENAMWQAFADASDPNKVPPAQARQYAADAFTKFLRDRATANRQRTDNPPPAPPSEVCH